MTDLFPGATDIPDLSGNGMGVDLGGGPTMEPVVNVLDYMTQVEVDDVHALAYTQNVTTALQNAAAQVVINGGGTLVIPPGGYLVGRQTLGGFLLDGVTPAAWGPEEVITIKNTPRGIRIVMIGATLKAAPGLRYGSFDPVSGNPIVTVVPFLDYSKYAYPYRAMINLTNIPSVVIDGGELDGNNSNFIVGGFWGDSQWQLEGSGMWIQNCAAITVNDTYIHHQPLDGIIVFQQGTTEASQKTPALFNNVKTRYNGRNNISVGGGIGYTFLNCDMSNVGQVANASLGGAKLQSSPGAGIDIEAEFGIIRDVALINCNIIGNWQNGLSAASGDTRRVKVTGGKIEGIIVSKPKFTFHDVTILGKCDFGIGLVDPYLGGNYTAKDGQLFHNCHFSHDATLTESGVLVNNTQSLAVNTHWNRFINCSFETGTAALPNFNVSPFGENTPLFQNCRFRSTSATPVNILGRYQGYNYIDYVGVVQILNGAFSRIESGAVIINGTPTYAALNVPDADYGDVNISGGVWQVQSGQNQFLVPGALNVKAANPASWGVLTSSAAGEFKIESYNNAGSGFEILTFKGSAIAFYTNNTFRGQIDAAGNFSVTGTIGGSNFSGTHSGASSGTNTGDQTITLTGDVTGTGTGSFAASIGNNKVTDAMIRDGAATSVIGRSANTVGDPADIAASADNQGLRRVGGVLGFGTFDLSTALFTGTLAAARMPALTGDVTTVAGNVATTIANNAVSFAKFQQVAASSLVGNPTGALANAQGITLLGGLGFSGTSLTINGAISVANSIKSTAANGGGSGIGYGTGAGGAVTQLTNKSTGVTLDRICGAITMNGAALAANTAVSFTFTNAAILADDEIMVWIKSGATTGGTYLVQVDQVAGGSCRISVRNLSAGSLSEALVLGFAVRRVVTA